MTFKQFIFYCALLLAAAYTILSFYPEAIFPEQYRHDSITIYSQTPLPTSTREIIGRVQEKISAHEFFAPGQKFNVYIAGSDRIYSLLAPFCRKDFSCLHPVTNKVFVATADFEKNLARSPGESQYPRTLEGVITHELVKAQVKHKLGSLNFLSLSEMKREGYPEHIAQETSDILPSGICEKNEKSTTLMRYLELRLALELLQFESEASYLALLQSGKGNDSSENRVKQKYCQ